MDLYLFCFCLGFGAFLSMALLGLSHAHGDGHHGGGHHGGSHHAGVGAGHGAHPVLGAAAPKLGRAPGGKSPWAFLSPRIMFGWLLGFGAAGLLLGPVLSGALLLGISLVCAWIFHRWILSPLWAFLFGFASTPARTLESALLDTAQAVTNFDRQGEGLIKVEVDGQIVQILGRLESSQRELGVRVRSGDRVSIMSLDLRRNRCTVAPVRG